MRSYRDRVIVGSPGAGQYRVFSSVREHSQHSATMAENGRQLPNAAPATLSSSLSLSLSLGSRCNKPEDRRTGSLHIRRIAG